MSYITKKLYIERNLVYLATIILNVVQCPENRRFFNRGQLKKSDVLRSNGDRFWNQGTKVDDAT